MRDLDFMRLAIDQARNGIGKTAPNPPVGAVVVKNGVVLGSGWHRAAGMPHAEREALAEAMQNHGPDAARGSTVYVTLEPCSTHGRTPPCTQGLIDAGVARVVYASLDRNPDHEGRADQILQASGIDVTAGLGREEAEKQLRPFFKVRTTGLPWLIWKTAMSLDGRITRPTGQSHWLTGDAARADVQRLRATVDAILTSGATVRADKPALTIRVPELLAGRTQPWRVVFTDAPDTLPRDAPLFADEWRERTLIRPRHDLAGSLRQLVSEQGVLCAMIEGGGILSAALFEAGLVDEVVVYMAPMITGGPSPALAGSGQMESLQLKEAEFIQIGNDIRFRGVIDR